jgi:chemotaxis methyl-accepting protein methylase
MTVELQRNPQTESDRLIEAVIAVVRRQTAHDFSRYREATIRRRIYNRMLAAGVPTLGSYLELLRNSRAEVAKLAENLTVKVSSFYRDTRAFDVVSREVLPLVARRRAGGHVRIWSAGCGRGEEAYTLAMLIEEQHLPGCILATDIDHNALSVAQTGVYSLDAIVGLPEDLSRTYCRSVSAAFPAHVAVGEVVRRRVRFRVHDMLSGTSPAPQAFDLICCRNVLIYLKREEQQRALRYFYRALAPGGFLFLGEAEWPTRAEHLFSRHPSGLRIFQTLD